MHLILNVVYISCALHFTYIVNDDVD